MPTISVAMIVKNEEHELAQCLDSVKDWVDEIIILDSGSTDNTPEIARQYGAKFYQHTDWQGFGRQRQIAQQYVTCDYVLWLDADERVSDELRQSIQAAVNANLDNTAYQICRLSEAFGKQIRHSGWYPDYVLRLYKTQSAQYGDELVHEKVHLPQNTTVKKLDGDLYHYTYKTVHQYLSKVAHYSQAWAEQKAAKGKKTSVTQCVTHSLGCFVRMYILRAGFPDGKQGFILAVLSAFSVFAKYANLWILNLKNRG